jgi:hypothetical protein
MHNKIVKRGDAFCLGQIRHRERAGRIIVVLSAFGKNKRNYPDAHRPTIRVRYRHKMTTKQALFVRQNLGLSNRMERR